MNSPYYDVLLSGIALRDQQSHCVSHTVPLSMRTSGCNSPLGAMHNGIVPAGTIAEPTLLVLMPGV